MLVFVKEGVSIHRWNKAGITARTLREESCTAHQTYGTHSYSEWHYGVVRHGRLFNSSIYLESYWGFRNPPCSSSVRTSQFDRAFFLLVGKALKNNRYKSSQMSQGFRVWGLKKLPEFNRVWVLWKPCGDKLISFCRKRIAFEYVMKFITYIV